MTQSTSNGVRSAIAAADEQFMAAYNAGDAAGLAALYTEDAQLMPPNSDFVAGREGLQGFWQAVMNMGIEKAQIDIIEVEDHGDTAIEVSRYELQDGSGQALDAGKFIVVWKRESGQWKLHRDIFNSSLPAQQ